MRSFFRFRIATLLLTMLAVSIAAGWIADRRRLMDKIENENPSINFYSEKLSYWSPASYLGADTESYESELADVIEFNGHMIVSSQGMGSPSLRQPDIKTLDQTIALFDSQDRATRVSAVKLVALYMQAVSGSGNSDPDSVATRVHFQAVGLQKARQQLTDADPDVRAASALILGNSLYDRDTVGLIKRTFDSDHNQTVKLHLAWAYWKIGHNYDKAEFYVK